MKNIMQNRTIDSSRLGSIIARMALANERLLNSKTAEERIRAGRWVVAWALAGGADPPAHLRLRPRTATGTDDPHPSPAFALPAPTGQDEAKTQGRAPI